MGTRAPGQACRASRNWRPRTPLRIRVAAVRSSQDAFPCLLREHGGSVSSFSFRLGSRALRGPPYGYAILSLSSRATWRSKADGPPIALERLRRARRPRVSHLFVARGAAHGGHGVVHGDGCAALAAAASRVFRSPQRAWRRFRRPPGLRPPTASTPPIARSPMPPRVRAKKTPFAARSFPFCFLRSLAVSLLTHD